MKHLEDATGLLKHEIDDIMSQYDKDKSGDIDFDESAHFFSRPARFVLLFLETYWNAFDARQ